MKITDKAHLKSVISEAIQLHGPTVSLNHLDVSSVTDMSHLFSGSGFRDFNGAIDQCDVSKVKDMCWMFYHAHAFQKPIGNWDVSNVRDMEAMFQNTHTFNQSLGSWNVSKVIYMNHMFRDTLAFNQPLEK